MHCLETIIKMNAPKKSEDKPQEDKVYMLIGGYGDKCIANGNTWSESVVPICNLCEVLDGVRGEICSANTCCLDCEDRVLTIKQIKELTKDTEPDYFTPKILRLWGQKLSDFKVTALNSGKYEIRAKCNKGTDSVRIFNPTTKRLEIKCY